MKPYYRILISNSDCYLSLKTERGDTEKFQSMQEAESVAHDLATLHPNETFEIVKVLGIVNVPTPQTFWMDGVDPRTPYEKVYDQVFGPF